MMFFYDITAWVGNSCLDKPHRFAGGGATGTRYARHSQADISSQHPAHAGMIIVEPTVQAVLDRIAAYRPPTVDKAKWARMESSADL